MVDEPLILAILADYSPDSFYASLPHVQEDLETLQASAVPDTDQDDTGAYPPAPSSSSPSIGPVTNADTGLGFTANQPMCPFSGSSRYSSSVSSRHSQQESAESAPPVVARDFASTASVKRFKTNRARPPITILPRPGNSFNSRAKRRSSGDQSLPPSDSKYQNLPPELDGSTEKEADTPVAAANRDGINTSDIPHLVDAPLKTFIEIAPGATLIEANPTESDTQESDTHESETETGLTTDETDEDLIPESAFDPLNFLKEIFASV